MSLGTNPRAMVVTSFRIPLNARSTWPQISFCGGRDDRYHSCLNIPEKPDLATERKVFALKQSNCGSVGGGRGLSTKPVFTNLMDLVITARPRVDPSPAIAVGALTPVGCHHPRGFPRDRPIWTLAAGHCRRASPPFTKQGATLQSKMNNVMFRLHCPIWVCLSCDKEPACGENGRFNQLRGGSPHLEAKLFAQPSSKILGGFSNSPPEKWPQRECKAMRCC